MPASPYSSVQQARQIMAARLREVMKDAGIHTGRELAARLGWQESKVSRILTAFTPPSEDDVRARCVACGAADEIPGLVASLRMAASAYVESRRMERTGLRAAQESVRPIYERTARFRVYSPGVLPGLLQTRDYTGGVLRNVQRRRGLTDDVDAAVEVRMDRQRILDDRSKRFVFVVEEHVLHTRVVDDDTMAAQLGHLLTVMADRPDIVIGVIPNGTLRQRPSVEGFWLYDDAQVSVELVGAYLTVTQPNEIALYEQAFTELAGLAVYRGDARKLIATAVATLG
jgi:hypothetical protein